VIRGQGFWYRLAAVLLRPPLMLLTRRDWRGGANLPRSGGVIVCANHLSYVDPLTCAHFVHDNGRLPRFLAKVELFRLPLAGRVLAGAGQIPVYRGSTDAAVAFRDAMAATARGECVVIYPEGTVTRDPGLWPMVGKTGAARIALATGVPVVPVAQWGPQQMLPPYTKKLRLLPRTTIRMSAGAPVDLSEFAGRPLSAGVLRSATERIMAAITAELETIRGETAPETRLGLRRHSA